MDKLPKRIMEPELMSREEAEIFHNNNIIVEQQEPFIEMFYKMTNFSGSSILDIGCSIGTLDICLAEFFPSLLVMGVDASEEAIEIGNKLVLDHKLSHRVLLKKAHIPKDEVLNRKQYFDGVFSRSTLHHFTNGLDFFNCIRKNTHPGSTFFMADLRRPLNEDDAWKFVHERIPEGQDILKKSYFNSFLSAYRPEEVKVLIHDSGIRGSFKMLANNTHIIVIGEIE